MTNQDLINHFYTSFANRDYKGMIDCYHSDIQFEDPAFGKLQGNDAKAMWQMLLTSNNNEIKITYSNVVANEKTGSAYWEAEYIFSQTGRKVLNKVNAQFEFTDGKISKHVDSFDMYAWSKQALGIIGFLFGWTSFMKSKFQKVTHKMLANFKKKIGTN